MQKKEKPNYSKVQEIQEEKSDKETINMKQKRKRPKGSKIQISEQREEQEAPE